MKGLLKKIPSVINQLKVCLDELVGVIG